MSRVSPNLKPLVALLALVGAFLLNLGLGPSVSGAAEVIFQDDMEGGLGSWFPQQPWAQTTQTAHTSSHSWTDSPDGNYSNNANVSLWSTSLDFSGVSSVKLTFWHRYDLEEGFDFGRVFITTDNGASFTKVASFTGTNTTWTQTTINLCAFAGQPSVRIVLQLLSDSIVTRDGWYIDDVVVVEATEAPCRSWLFGIDSGADDDSSTLLRIDHLSGDTHKVGETGFKFVTDVAFLPDGTLFGLSFGNQLLKIDPQGVAVPVGSLAVSGLANALVSDVAGLLYAATTSGGFYKIDPDTGTATLIGSYGMGLGSSGDLAFDLDGTLFGTATDGSPSDLLVRVDVATGQATVVGAVGFPDVFGLALGPDEELYGAANGDSNVSTLIRINKTTGVGTAIQQIANASGMFGLAANVRLSPVVGPLTVTGPENPSCENAVDLWTFCQHRTDLHRPKGGIRDSDDTYAWDVNLRTNTDTNADRGKPVFAVAPGKVVKYAGDVPPQGNASGAVLVEHPIDGSSCELTPASCWWSGYLHMSDIQVLEDQPVDAATLLGFISNVSPDAIPDHLHFVIYEGANVPGKLRSVDATFNPRQMSDSTSPTNVQVTAPTSGQTISGIFTFKGTAQDNSGTVQKMELYIDDIMLACLDTIPKASGSTFQCNWDSTTKLNGPHTVKAKAYDPSGNSAFSPSVSFTINNPLPDLIISSLTAPAESGAGLTIIVKATTRNRGEGTAGQSTTRVYFSTNTKLDGDVELCSPKGVGPLGPGAYSLDSFQSCTIPQGTAPGTYYVIVKADADNTVPGETSEINNTKYKAIKIGPDLIISSLSAPTSARRGLTIPVKDTTKNQGGGTAGASTTKFYLSTNKTIGAGDVLICSRNVPSLAPEKSSPGPELPCPIPLDTDLGLHYIVTKADGDNGVPEFSETNNIKTRAIEIVP